MTDKMASTRRLDELTNPDVEKMLAERALVLVPCGSTEQHGPHLPTGTDYIASLTICDRVAAQIGGIVLPGFQFGVTPIHMGFTGTVTVTPDTYERVLFDLVASLATHGVREVAFVNWHEGNIASLSTVASRLTFERELDVVIAHACYVAEELFGADLGGLTHGGAIEAAAVLGSRPELARLDRVDWTAEAGGERDADLARRGRAFQTVLRDIREISENGWYGNAGQVDEEQGQSLLAAVSAAVAKELDSRFERLAIFRRKEKR